jgi:hypothetical protein
MNRIIIVIESSSAGGTNFLRVGDNVFVVGAKIDYCGSILSIGVGIIIDGRIYCLNGSS